MTRKTIFLTSAIWLAFCASLFAQRAIDVSAVEAKATTTKIVVTETVLVIDGESSVVSDSVPGTPVESTSQVGRIQIGGDSVEGIQVQAFNQDFELAALESLSGSSWIVRKPGRYLVSIYIPGEYVPLRVLVVPGTIEPGPVEPVPITESPLEKVCRDAMASVTDPAKASKAIAMAALYDAEAVKIEDGQYATVAEMMAAISQGNRDILGDARQGWQEWRSQIAISLIALKDDGKLETVKDHAAHWRGIARGMK